MPIVRYEYRMQPVPWIDPKPNRTRGQQASDHLEAIVNRMAVDGWEFVRLDPVGVLDKPGCLGTLSGFGVTIARHDVATFRRPRNP